MSWGGAWTPGVLGRIRELFLRFGDFGHVGESRDCTHGCYLPRDRDDQSWQFDAQSWRKFAIQGGGGSLVGIAPVPSLSNVNLKRDT